MLRRRTKRALISLSVITLTAVLASLIILQFFTFLQERRAAEEARAAIRPPEVRLLTLQPEDMERHRRFSARLEPWAQAAVSSEVTGRVVRLAAEPGSLVKEGDLLLELEDRMARLSVVSGEAALAASLAREADFSRQLREAEALVRTEALSRSELERVRAQLQIQQAEILRQEAELDRLRENLHRHRIHAPFEGIVNQRLVNLGDTVSPLQPVYELVALDPLRVVFHVSETEYGALPEGSVVRVRSPIDPAVEMEATVEHRSRAADRRTGLFRLEAHLPNPEGTLSGGLLAVVSAPVTLYRDTLFVPAGAVRLDGPRRLVEMQDREGLRQWREITVDRELEGRFPVRAGLTPGDTILVR